jgi:hypothetical protein
LLYFGLNSQTERVLAARRPDSIFRSLKRILVAP